MKKLVLFVLIFFSFLPLEAELYSETITSGTRNFLSIRVEFQKDLTSLTTGNGNFMLSEWTGHDTTYVLDTLPHNRAYFASHLEFLDNYWNRASNGNIRINTADDHQLPLADSAFTLPNPMHYYTNLDSLDYRLARFVYESVKMASDAGQYQDDLDALVIYHAGAGQDFKITLDDSPFDIPSFYFDEDYLAEYLPSQQYNELMALNCKEGIVLPESQNQLAYNIALNGTEVLLSGMLLGLPTLYDTELGRSGAGVFGLMDQGSNTGNGLCPIKPSAFERYLLGASQPLSLTESGIFTIKRDEIYHLPISSNEYFLIEYRKNSGAYADSITWNRDDVNNYLDVLYVLDSLDLIDYTVENGVLTDYSDLDVGLAHDGLLIWHVNEGELGVENPNDWDSPFLNLIEADGGDDVGKYYGSLNTTANNGWKWDIWFYNNPGYFDNNQNSFTMKWDDNSFPNTRSFENLSSGISINKFDFYSDSVSITLQIDSPAIYNFNNIVFDEMTSALPDDILADELLLGFSDSTLVLLNNGSLREIYSSDTLLAKTSTALMTYNNDILLITNSENNAKVRHLEYLASSLQEVNSTTLPYLLDLEHVALFEETLLLPPQASSESHAVYTLDISTWALESSSNSDEKIIPSVLNDELRFVTSKTSAVRNDDLIYALDNGYTYSIVSTGDVWTFASEHQLSKLIPILESEDGQANIVALTNFQEKNTLSLFTRAGKLMNNFPIYGNYQKLRVYYLDENPMYLAYDPSGKIDVFNSNAELQFSLPVPVNATSLFLEQISLNEASLVIDGSVYPIPSTSVYWGYEGMNAAHTNAVNGLFQEATPVESDFLIKDELVYNYPNPTKNDRTKFRFFATGANQVSINIYSLNGMPIESLNQNVIDQQWNEIIWDVSEETSGVYIAKITFSGDNREETYFIKPAILK